VPVNARGWLPYIVIALVAAVAVHLGTVWYLPHLVMDKAMTQMGAVNTIHHGLRATAGKRGVVRPSPDLLYSVCPYDLSSGAPLHVTAPVPPGTYWSVSVFDDATNNVFVLNDTHAGRAVDFLIVPMNWQKPMPYRVVRSPSDKGLVVFRTLVNDETNLAAIDKARRKAKCAPL
jgi:uncharacterized membrane protein